MYSLNDLTIEIEQGIEQMKGESRLHPDWITQAVWNRHQEISGKDSDFHTLLSHEKLRDQVRKALNRYKLKPDLEPDRQLVLPGFKRLQERYLIAEDGEQVAIRVQDMTSFQRLEKAAELRAMGDGCYQHADELERYDRLIAA